MSAAISSSKNRRQHPSGNAFQLIFISSVQYNCVTLVSHSRLLLVAGRRNVNKTQIAKLKIKEFVPMMILRTDEFYE